MNAARRFGAMLSAVAVALASIACARALDTAAGHDAGPITARGERDGGTTTDLARALPFLFGDGGPRTHADGGAAGDGGPTRGLGLRARGGAGSAAYGSGEGGFRRYEPTLPERVYVDVTDDDATRIAPTCVALDARTRAVRPSAVDVRRAIECLLVDLEPELNDPDPQDPRDVSTRAGLAVLGRAGAAGAAALARALPGIPYGARRDAAITALGTLGDRAGAPALLALLLDEPPGDADDNLLANALFSIGEPDLQRARAWLPLLDASRGGVLADAAGPPGEDDERHRARLRAHGGPNAALRAVVSRGLRRLTAERSRGVAERGLALRVVPRATRGDGAALSKIDVLLVNEGATPRRVAVPRPGGRLGDDVGYADIETATENGVVDVPRGGGDSSSAPVVVTLAPGGRVRVAGEGAGTLRPVRARGFVRLRAHYDTRGHVPGLQPGDVEAVRLVSPDVVIDVADAAR